VIYSENACDVIKREDSVETFVYCDPPYLKETRSVPDAYSFEMSNEDHIRLLMTLGQMRGKFILSGYPSDTYDSAANQFGWKRVDVKIDNKASSKKKKPTKTSSLS
jgi:DNA adenine methylase